MSIEIDTSSSQPKRAQPASKRNVNGWAIACTVGGLLSVLVLRHPAFFVIPGLTALAGLVAFALAIRTGQLARAVPFLAVGLLLAAGFSGVAARSMRNVDPLSEKETRRFVEYWMSLLQRGNDMITAFMLTAEPSQRPPAATDLKAYVHDNPILRERYQRFYEDEFVRLLRLGIKPEYKHEKTVLLSKARGKATFWYDIEYDDFAKKRRQARAEVIVNYEFGVANKPSGWWVEIVNLPIGFKFIKRPD